MSDTPFDVIVYGATGFTGRQAARYLDRNAPPSLRWAIAGRSPQKLDDLAGQLSDVGGVVVADSKAPETIREMVQQARVVLTTVGPYALYGEPVLAACAEAGVDYVDITGESLWVRQMIDRHDAAAKASGARIIPFCGYDSVPSDLGTWMMVQALKERGETARRVKGFFIGKGGFNGGTLLSALHLLEEADVETLRDPFLLNPDGRTPDNAAEHTDWLLPKKDPDLGRWAAPFVMAPVNTRVVRRSAALAEMWGAPYGPSFVYEEAMGPLNASTAFSVTAALGAMVVGGQLKVLRDLARRYGPSAGEGPSEETMDNGFTRVRLYAEGDRGRRLRGLIHANGDPGNRFTVLTLCESALALALQRDALPGGAERTGILTPAMGLGGVLLDRLKDAGVTITVNG
ncbi:MAG: saccharopine dehydrogenase NADP-binding domain-containing protein [Myxococcota bacterium]